MQSSKLDINDSLRLASILHSVSAISRKVSPFAGCQGIDVIHGDTFDLHCLHPMVTPSHLPLTCLKSPFLAQNPGRLPCRQVQSFLSSAILTTKERRDCCMVCINCMVTS